MSDNPKSYEVILFDHSEVKNDESGQYLSVFNLDGTNYKINAKRQSVWKPFEKSQKGTPILLTFETFTPLGSKEKITYIADAQVATFDKIWQSGIQATLKRLLLAKDDDRMRSQALAYAKDIEVARIMADKSIYKHVDTENILDVATTFFYFIKGQQDIEVPPITPSDDKPKVEEEYQK